MAASGSSVGTGMSLGLSASDGIADDTAFMPAPTSVANPDIFGPILANAKAPPTAMSPGGVSTPIEVRPRLTAPRPYLHAGAPASTDRTSPYESRGNSPASSRASAQAPSHNGIGQEFGDLSSVRPVNMSADGFFNPSDPPTPLNVVRSSGAGAVALGQRLPTVRGVR